jgi:8-oxo-dGTP pyrophosphatase MutT (NUDIX family)
METILPINIKGNKFYFPLPRKDISLHKSQFHFTARFGGHRARFRDLKDRWITNISIETKDGITVIQDTHVPERINFLRMEAGGKSEISIHDPGDTLDVCIPFTFCNKQLLNVPLDLYLVITIQRPANLGYTVNDNNELVSSIYSIDIMESILYLFIGYVPCAGIILMNGKKVLIVTTHKGNQGFPKGKRHKGESLMDTAFREVFEETGITKDEIKLIPNLELDECKPTKTNISVRYYVGTTEQQELKFDKSELAKVEWESIDSVRLPEYRQKLLDTVVLATTYKILQRSIDEIATIKV